MATVFTNTRVIVVVLVVAGIAAVAMWPESIAVELVAVARGPMEVTIDEEGETRVRQRFVVSAPVTGRLQRVELEPGDAVAKRQDGGAADSGRLAAARCAHAGGTGGRPRGRTFGAGAGARPSAVEPPPPSLPRHRLERRQQLVERGLASHRSSSRAQTDVTGAEESSAGRRVTVARARERGRTRRRADAVASDGQRPNVCARRWTA